MRLPQNKFLSTNQIGLCSWRNILGSCFHMTAQLSMTFLALWVHHAQCKLDVVNRLFLRLTKRLICKFFCENSQVVYFDIRLSRSNGELRTIYIKYDPSCEIIVLYQSIHQFFLGGLPWFLEKTHFKGRVFMTHPTKAIYR